MPSYIRFQAASTEEEADPQQPQGFLIEVAAAEVAARPDGGTQKAGLHGVLQGTIIGQAQQSLQEVLTTAVQFNAEAFLNAVDALPRKPASAELNFALKITGEAGNVAVGKIGGEANYTVKLVWTKEQA